MLAEKVAAGELPPVEERLPKNPLIAEPLEEIGEYGGTWRRANTGPWGIYARIGGDPLVTYGRDTRTIEPNVAWKWEVSDDGKEYTFYLREGIRWSDGEPFTADDIMFWYEDVVMNEDLNPSVPKWLSPGGEPVVVEKIDDYTVKFKFAVPYGLILDMLCFRGRDIPQHPKHYLKQFHPKYADADELAKMVEDRGFEEWYQLFGERNDPSRNTELPTLRPWKLTTENWTTTAFAERNPYYWKLDTAGNQLPYIDKVMYWIVESAELIPMRVVSGEIDMQAFKMGFKNYTLYMENREKGDYEVRIWGYGTSGTSMHMNQTKGVEEGDEVGAEVRELLRNRDFRVALSKAIDREDINELVFMGKADDTANLYPEKVKNDPEILALWEYNVDEANRILDEIGLDQRDAEGMRLLPSGEPLNLIMIGHVAYAIHKDIGEVVAEFWKEIGVRVTLDWIAGELWWPRVQEGDYDIVAYECDYTSGNAHWLTYPRSYFPVETSTYWAPRWGVYYQTDGQDGEEPPEGDAKKLVDIYDQVIQETDLEKRKELEDEAFRICAWNLWPIPTVGGQPEPCIVKNNFKNVQEWTHLAWAVYGPLPTKPYQYFMVQA